MCGIIGCVSKKNIIPILIDGLKSLEYRGYDSAGIAYIDELEVKTIKSIGKIANLEKKVDNELKSNMGIGHTRWATHGGISLENCHPHTIRDVTLVHNGIIENYLDIKKKLEENGYVFKGESDSEVICGLIDYCYKEENDKITALERVKKEITGSYAFGIIFHDEIDKIYAMRKDSPLVLGIDKQYNFISSDIQTITKYTNKYILLDYEDIAIITKDNYKVINNGDVINKTINTYNYQIDNSTLTNFEHYMLKEIYEQPMLIRNNFMDNLDLIPDISKYQSIYIVACGSAYNAGLIGKYLIEEYANKKVDIQIASEFRYNKLFLNKDDLVIVISQSGETADTLAAVRIAKKMSANTLALVNVYDSSIARLADNVLYTNALTEKAVATTKAYMMQVFYLGLIAIKASKINYQEIDYNYKILANQIDLILANLEYKEIAKEIYNKKDIFFLGRGIDYGLCQEASLKLKEISYIHSEAYPAGELKHGTISLIDNESIVISIITSNNIKDKIISNIKEVISRGAKSYIICTDDIDIENEYYHKIIRVPSNTDILKPILAIIPLQLLAYEVAKLNNCEIDQPRNLAKSVTVE